jgi:hypothetical protein
MAGSAAASSWKRAELESVEGTGEIFFDRPHKKHYLLFCS